MLKRLQEMRFRLFMLDLMEVTGVTPVFLMLLIFIIGNSAGVVFAQEGNLTLPNEPVMTLGQGYITNVQYSPDGKYLAVATSLSIELLETQNYQRVRFWDERARVTPFNADSISFSPDNKLLAVASERGPIRIFDVESGKARILREGGPFVYCLSFRPDGKLLTWTDDLLIRVWDTDTGKEIKAVKTNLNDYLPRLTYAAEIVQVGAYAFSPDGRFLAFDSSRDYIIEVWDANIGTKLKELKGGSVRLAFASDGKKLASIAHGGEVILWDIESGLGNVISKVVDHPYAPVPYLYLTFSPDGKFLAWVSVNTVWIMDIAKQRSKTFEAPTHMLFSLSFSPSGKLLVASFTELVVYDISTIFGWGKPIGKKLDTIQIFLAPVRSISFSADGKFLASGSDISGEIDLLDISSGGRKRSLQGHLSFRTIVAFSHDGKSLFSVPEWKPVIEWDIESGAKIKEFGDGAGSIALSPDNKVLSLGAHGDTRTDNAIHLWDTVTRKPLKTLKTTVELSPQTGGHAFSPDGKVLVAAFVVPFSPGGDWEKVHIRLWDVESGTMLKQLGEKAGIMKSLAFSPDGSILASSVGGLTLWDVAIGKEITNLSPNNSPNSIAFSPDGKFLLAGFGDGTIGLWESGWKVNVPWKHTDSVNSISFSGDGRFLASGSSDGTIKIWEISLLSPQSTKPNNPPLKPSNLTPADKAENIALTPTLEASAFSDKDTGDTLRTSQWQITDKPGNYALPVFDSGVIFNDQIVFTVPAGILKPNTIYFWRVRYQDSRGKWSEYSAETSFKTTSTPATPIIPESVVKATLSLKAGLNIVSLPLKPEVVMTARSFAQKLGATFIVEFDKTQNQFSTFVPQIATTQGFEIKGGLGYIVNLLAPVDVSFSGTAWSGRLAPSLESSESEPIWAFVVGGIIHPEYEALVLSRETWRVRIKNLRSGAIQTTSVEMDDDGRFAVSYVDLSENSVVKLGDYFEVAVYDSRGRIISGPVRHRVDRDDLRKALSLVSLRMGEVIPDKSSLGQNYPNPFNPETWIPFRLSQGSEVSLQIYDVSGRLIRGFDLEYLEAGIYEHRARAIYWDGRNDLGERVASGVYYYRFQAGSFSAIRKLAILK